ncbi:TRAP transporter permease [Halobacteriales archaeon Cl-PHB]
MTAVNPRPIYESIQRGCSVLISLLSVLFVGLLFYYSLTLSMTRHKFSVIFICFVMVIYFSYEIVTHDWTGDSIRENYEQLTLIGLLVASATTSIYVALTYQTLRFVRIGYSTELDLVVAAVLLFAILYGTLRDYGKAFAGVLVGSLLYAYFGPYFPGIFYHSGFNIEAILEFSVIELASSGGAYGYITGVIATWIAMFVIFSGLVQGFGGMDWIKQCGKYIGQYMSTGPVQTAVLSSMGFGSISGSGAANVAITGSFTIPLMKESQGLPGRYAAAIESVASSGGQLMPPIMGASIFIMADLLAINLGTLLAVAVIPALIFYASVAYAGHLVGKNKGTKADVDGSFEKVTAVELITTGYVYYIPLLFLTYLLVVEQRGILMAGVYSNTLLVVLAIGKVIHEHGFSLESVTAFLRQGDTGLREGMTTMASLGVVGAAVGVILNVITISAVAQHIALYLLDISGNSLPILLILVMLLAIVLGMGAPTIAAYLITALLLAPSLVQMGIPQLQAHFFVFYFAVTSYITPPIAVASVIASRIAETSFLSVAFESVKFGSVLYILPFTFVYLNLIPADGTVGLTTVVTGGAVLCAMLLLMSAFYSGKSRVSRFGYYAAAALVMVGGTIVF